MTKTKKEHLIKCAEYRKTHQKEIKKWRKEATMKYHKEYTSFKQDWSCSMCGYSKYQEAINFHHVNPDDKQFHVNETTWTYKKFGDELQKCVPLCANCHRHITRKEMN